MQRRPPRRRIERFWLLQLSTLVLMGLSTPCGFALAAEAGGASPGATSEAELPPLPPAPKLDPPAPERADVEDLEARLRRLVSDSLDERKEAVREVLEVRPKLVAAVLVRLDKLAESADRERMKRALSQAREKSSRATDSAEARADARQDLLMQLVERARPKDEGWRELVELLALSRMLTQIGNVHGARGLVEIYVRFGEFMRVDVQNRLLDLKDGSIAALIEARRHRAEKVARWAERQLDRMGKVAPSEAIRTDNFEVLADILRAYGRTKDPDAARIIVTYASSERYQLREAAREAIVLLGQVGIWQLREAYETVVGKRPRRDWSWDRTARELFFEYDKLHAAKTFELLDVGNKAAAEGRLEDMAKAYDDLLARSPQFDKAFTIAPGYLRYAEKVAKSDRAAAEAALVRVERLATDVTLKQRARSLRDSLRAERQMADGVIDTYLIKRAVERDPNNQRAKELLSVGDRAKVEALTTRTRWLTSGAIGLTAVIAILLIWLRRGQPASAAAPPEHELALENSTREATPAKVERANEAETQAAAAPEHEQAPENSTREATLSADVLENGVEERATAAPEGVHIPARPARVEPPANASTDTAGAAHEPPADAPKQPRDPFEDIF